MMKNCIIYTYEGDVIKNINTEIFKNLTLEECLENASGKTLPKLRALKELTQDEKIILKKDLKDKYIFEVSCKFRGKKLLASGGDVPFYSVKYDIWVDKNKPLVITFDSGRKLSGVGVSLLATALFQNPGFIKFINLEREDFDNLKDLLIKYEPSGSIRRVTLKSVELEETKFKQIVLSSSQLENSDIFNRFFDASNVVTNISFLTPPLESSDRYLSCRINHWGSLTIYSQDLLDTEITELIKMILQKTNITRPILE